jgi:WD40 repeat protein
MERITEICAVGEYLAVASDQYEVVHVYSHKSNGEICARLVGHTMGITALSPHPTNGQILLTGSADMTIKLWNLETGIAQFHFVRHGGAVSAIAIATYKGSQFMFTGGRDKKVHGWDLTRKKGMCHISTENRSPVKLCFDSDAKQLSIVVVDELAQADTQDWLAVRRTGQVQNYIFRKAEPAS